MQFDYAMTVEDWREAHSRGSYTGPQKPTSPLFVYIPLLTLCVTAAYLGDGSLPSRASPERNLWLDVIPSILAVHVLLLVKLGSTIFPHPLRRRSFKRTSRLHLFWAVPLLYSPVVWLIPACFLEMSIIWRPSNFQVLGAAAVPWVFYAGIVSYRQRWRQKKRLANFDANKQLAFPACHFELTDEFFSTDDGKVYRRIRWSAFSYYKETKNLLLLVFTNGAMQVVGKRSITDVTAMNELRRLISDHIREGDFLPQKAAFPVLAPLNTF